MKQIQANILVVEYNNLADSLLIMKEQLKEKADTIRASFDKGDKYEPAQERFLKEYQCLNEATQTILHAFHNFSADNVNKLNQYKVL